MNDQERRIAKDDWVVSNPIRQTGNKSVVLKVRDVTEDGQAIIYEYKNRISASSAKNFRIATPSEVIKAKMKSIFIE